LRKLHPDAAGIDVGASEIFVAVPADRDAKPVRSFETFTRDLNALADWLEDCGIRSVAMESTSVYWIPLQQILEARGIKVHLVTAEYVKNVRGRKTDVSGLPVDSVSPLGRVVASQFSTTGSQRNNSAPATSSYRRYGVIDMVKASNFE
jgi:hypothetical protein